MTRAKQGAGRLTLRLLLCWMWLGAVHGDTLFVAPGGNDTQPCTSSNQACGSVVVALARARAEWVGRNGTGGSFSIAVAPGTYNLSAPLRVDFALSLLGGHAASALFAANGTTVGTSTPTLACGGAVTSALVVVDAADDVWYPGGGNLSVSSVNLRGCTSGALVVNGSSTYVDASDVTCWNCTTAAAASPTVGACVTVHDGARVNFTGGGAVGTTSAMPTDAAFPRQRLAGAVSVTQGGRFGAQGVTFVGSVSDGCGGFISVSTSGEAVLQGCSFVNGSAFQVGTALHCTAVLCIVAARHGGAGSLCLRGLCFGVLTCGDGAAAVWCGVWGAAWTDVCGAGRRCVHSCLCRVGHAGGHTV